MASGIDDPFQIDSDDDLVELTPGRPRNALPFDFDHLLNPHHSLPDPRQGHGDGLNSNLRPRRHAERTRSRLGVASPSNASRATTVIDLTEEPDSPEEERSRPPRHMRAPTPLARMPGPPSVEPQDRANRNPRRTHSQRISPPMLVRSDSTSVAQPGIIDLTADSPEDERPAMRLPRPPRPAATAAAANIRAAQHHHHHLHHHFRRGDGRDELIGMEGVFPQGAVNMIHNTLRRRFGGIFGAEANEVILMGDFNPPQLDVTRNAFAAREESPKPAMDPVTPARDGFTRDTCGEPEGGLERVVICPACEEELAYDPNGGSVASAASGARGKRKRAPGEHHFWALKKCGHVYCADCFENRKPKASNPRGVGFRMPGIKEPQRQANDILCAVEGCPTKVAAKGEWLGIFL